MTTISTLVPQMVEAHIPQLLRAYRQIYGLPLDAGSGFAPMLTEHAQRVGFRLCVAYGAQGGLVGFGYGFVGQPGQAWRDGLAAALGPTATAYWLSNYFEFAEFGVIPEARRRGVAGRLYDALFSALPFPRGVLTVRESNLPARRFYESRGWQPLHQDFYAPSGRGPYIIMGREQ